MSADVEVVIASRERSVGTHRVGRVLPTAARRTIGPFIFFDHMGPIALPPGEGFDVLPHPHIGLSTVTYLFEGEAVHRDSLGSTRVIRPGDINWMTAGRGIVHSERSGPDARAHGGRLHGLQLWVALPAAVEEMAPTFDHYPGATLPSLETDGARIRVLAGSAYGLVSPVKTSSPLVYVEARLPAGASILAPSDHPQRAAYLVEGSVTLGDITYPERNLLVLAPGERRLFAERDTHVVFIGGDPLDQPHYIEWNFVATSKERIAVAKRDWKERRFPVIADDPDEFVPLPE